MGKTIGERRVKIDFNTTGSTIVDNIKRRSAELIDLIESVRDIREFEDIDAITEYIRLRERAMTYIEDGCSIAVKAFYSEKTSQ
jgi:hypothetical protein